MQNVQAIQVPVDIPYQNSGQEDLPWSSRTWKLPEKWAWMNIPFRNVNTQVVAPTLSAGSPAFLSLMNEPHFIGSKLYILNVKNFNNILNNKVFPSMWEKTEHSWWPDYPEL